MSEELICPDCGGVIGGQPGTGRAVCRCFEERPRAATAVAPAPLTAPPADLPPADPDAKPCRVCGKDLRGHRRLKDSRGYVCVKCDEEQRRMKEIEDAQDLSLIPCPECGRRLKPEGITTVNGLVMCKTCAKDHRELNKYKTPPPGIEDHKEREKQTLRNLLIIAGVLLCIMALAYFGFIGRR